MAFAIDAGQRMVRERVDFRVARLPVFDPALGTSVRDPALDARLEELTIYFTVFSFIVPRTAVAVVASIDEALASGSKDFCLVQNAGHIFYGHGGLAADLLEALDGCEFLTGRLAEGGGYFYFSEQCILVNRRCWEKLGRPHFGVPMKQPSSSPFQIIAIRCRPAATLNFCRRNRHRCRCAHGSATAGTQSPPALPRDCRCDSGTLPSTAGASRAAPT